MIVVAIELAPLSRVSSFGFRGHLVWPLDNTSHLFLGVDQFGEDYSCDDLLVFVDMVYRLGGLFGPNDPRIHTR
ncbi:unnamed protein product [Cochlearia groenlandica]